MQIGISFLTSKIARRFFFLFLSCALLPMIIFVWISYQRVSDQLFEQSSRRLKNDTKIYGMALMDRLMHMKNLLHLYSTHIDEGSNLIELPKDLENQLISQFDGVSLYQNNSRLSRYRYQLVADRVFL